MPSRSPRHFKSRAFAFTQHHAVYGLEALVSTTFACWWLETMRFTMYSVRRCGPRFCCKAWLSRKRRHVPGADHPQRKQVLCRQSQSSHHQPHTPFLLVARGRSWLLQQSTLERVPFIPSQVQMLRFQTGPNHTGFSVVENQESSES